MYTDIGALIAERRREKGMHQAELAAALDERRAREAAAVLEKDAALQSGTQSQG